uniref:Uncharacterized protein n=2 Tax=Gloeothece TaxID=28070 RepID=E0ULC4_GLOV7|nr:hypothetical protein Cyan7822_5900 [Gloeothece verrucosa PCC 7822]
MVIALGLGVAILFIALAALIASETHQKIVNSEIQTKKIEDALDSGLAHFGSFMAKNGPLLDINRESWTSHINSDTPSDLKLQKLLRICKTDQEWNHQKELIDLFASGGFQMLESSNKEPYSFAVPEFDFNADKNILKVVLLAQNSDGSAVSQLNLQFQVNTPPLKIPVLWVQKGWEGTGYLTFEGNVWASNCSFPIDKVRLKDDTYQAKYVALEPPPLPNLEEIVSRIPTSQQKLILKDSSANSLLSLPRVKDKPSLEASNAIETLPVYEYVVSSMALKNKSLKINTMYNGKHVKIVLYLLGSIESGTEIQHLCGTNPECNPEDLVIVGYGGDGKDTLGEWDLINPQICLTGSDNIEALIVAPGYQLGLKRKNITDKYFIFFGSVFVGNLVTSGFCGDNDASVLFTKPVEINKLPEDFKLQNFYPQITKVLSYSSTSSDFSLKKSEIESGLIGLESKPVPPESEENFELSP